MRLARPRSTSGVWSSMWWANMTFQGKSLLASCFRTLTRSSWRTLWIKSCNSILTITGYTRRRRFKKLRRPAKMLERNANSNLLYCKSSSCHANLHKLQSASLPYRMKSTERCSLRLIQQRQMTETQIIKRLLQGKNKSRNYHNNLLTWQFQGKRRRVKTTQRVSVVALQLRALVIISVRQAKCKMNSWSRRTVRTYRGKSMDCEAQSKDLIHVKADLKSQKTL